MTARYDVTIVGGGVVGAAIAWRLSRDQARVLWLEARHDVAEGTSKANSAIMASGYDTTPGTLESELVCASSPRWEQIAHDLDIPFARIGSLALAFDEADAERLSELLVQAHANDVAAEIVDGEAARRLAPAASAQACAALHVPGEAIIDSIRLTTAYAELAVRNGVRLLTCTPLTGVEHGRDGRITAVDTPAGTFGTRALINAAGLYGDEVSRLAGGERFEIWPRRGQFVLLDREVGRRVNMILTAIPTEHTRGVLAIPTTNRSLLLGPTAEDREDKHDRSTDEQAIAQVLGQARRLVPGIRAEHVLKTFSGLRPASSETYRVEVSPTVPNLVQAAAIRSTGVSSSPALADRVRELVTETGIDLQPAPAARTHLPSAGRPAETATDQLARAVAGAGPAGRQIVCACEHVTAAEIEAALHQAVPATSLDGVRKRTRAGGGRCQGAYCLAGITFMLSLHRALAPSATPQGEPGSDVGVADVTGGGAREHRGAARRPRAWAPAPDAGDPSGNGPPAIAIVGAGAAGLACAASLAGRARVILIERLPVAGGEHWREPLVAGLVDEARSSGACLLAGATALRWNGHQLTVLAHDGLRAVSAAALVIATGHRPRTRGELRLTGERGGGILPATVALHLLAHRALIGHRPLIIGGADWAAGVAAAALGLGAERATIVAPSGTAAGSLEPASDPRLRVYDGAQPLATLGSPRVAAIDVRLADDGPARRIACDAVVLAEGRVPWRNVDGAVFAGPNVVFAQTGDAARDDARSAQQGRATAAQALQVLAAPAIVDRSQEPPTRIGGPDASVLTRR